MSGVAAAISGGAGVLSAGLGFFGSKSSAKKQQAALQQAAAAQDRANQAALAAQNQVTAVNRQMIQPYVTSGVNALSQLSAGVQLPYSAAQLAESATQTALQNQQEQNRYNTERAAYDSAVHQRNLAINRIGMDYYKHPHVKATLDAQLPIPPEPAPPNITSALSNDGRGEFSQRTNMTPTEWFASEAAAGRAVDPSKQNWNADFDMTGWLASQGRAANALTRDFAMSDYEADPGYAFRLAQGTKALENTAAARGNQLSGATLKAMSEYNQGQASQEYQNAVNRYNVNRSNLQGVGYKAYDMFNIDQNKLYGRFTDAYGRQAIAKQQDFSNIYNLSNQGLNAMTSMMGSAQTGANNVSNLLTSQGQNQANALIQQGVISGQGEQAMYGALGQGLGSLSSAFTDYNKGSTGQAKYDGQGTQIYNALTSSSYQPAFNAAITPAFRGVY